MIEEEATVVSNTGNFAEFDIIRTRLNLYKGIIKI
jgi:hypothetical protein